ncbi:hypothetical protein J6590_081490 [Homalodisca vitripennis]|nr:hypothetical protein J6590_081490 [Homalodisca vitripennis]
MVCPHAHITGHTVLIYHRWIKSLFQAVTPLLNKLPRGPIHQTALPRYFSPADININGTSAEPCAAPCASSSSPEGIINNAKSRTPRRRFDLLVNDSMSLACLDRPVPSSLTFTFLINCFAFVTARALDLGGRPIARPVFYLPVCRSVRRTNYCPGPAPCITDASPVSLSAEAEVIGPLPGVMAASRGAESVIVCSAHRHGGWESTMRFESAYHCFWS